MTDTYLISAVIVWSLMLIHTIRFAMRSRNRAEDVGYVITLGVISVVHILPGLHYVAFHDEYILKGGSATHLIIGLYIDFVSMVLWAGGYRWAKNQFLRNKKYSLTNNHWSKARLSFYVMSTLSVIFAILNYIMFTNFQKYGEGVRIYYETQRISRSFGIYTAFSLFATFLPTILVGLYLLCQNKKTQVYSRSFSNKKEIILLVTICIYAIIRSFFLAQRHPIVDIFLGLVSIWYLQGQFRRIILVSASGLILLFILSPYLEQLRSFGGGYVGLERYLVSLEKRGSFIHQENKFYYSIANLCRRTDLAVNSGIVYDMTKSTQDFALFKPYAGLIFGMIPRIIWPDRPLAGSIDGTLGGTVDALVCKWRGIYHGVVATVGLGGSLFWEFGYIGVIIGSWITGAIAYLICLIVFRTRRLTFFCAWLVILKWGVGLAYPPDTLLWSLTRPLIAVGICEFIALILSKVRHR